MHGIEVTADDDALYELVIGVASGAVDKPAVAEFLRTHSAR